MKRLLLSVLSSLLSTISISQIGNEWIDFGADKRYVKFQIAETGLYRIDRASLQFALQSLSPPVNISNIDPRAIQIFAKGAEVPIHIEGQGDGTFDNGDYIELFCESNDGWLDERLYPNDDEHTNPYYSLYTDTLTYFLTWLTDGSYSSERYTDIPYTTAAVSPMPYFWVEQVKSPNNIYHDGRNIGSGVTNALYHGGKGWTSREFGYNGNTTRDLADLVFDTPNALTGSLAPSTQIETGLVGVNTGAGGQDAHHVRLRYKNGATYVEFDDVYLESYGFVKHNTTLSTTLLNTGEIRLDAFASIDGSTNETSSDYSAMSFLKLKYPHRMDVQGEGISQLHFKTPASTNEWHFNLANWGTQNVTHIYDPAMKRRYAISQNGNTLKANVLAGAERELYLQSNNTITNLAPSDFETVGSDGRFVDYSNLAKDSAFLIITHNALMTSASQYAAYRNSTHSGRTVLIDIEELYDQFAYGVKLSPLSIRGFCEYAITNWSTQPQYLLLLGKAIEESSHRQSTAARAQLRVPTMGSPPTDNMLTMGLGSHPYAPAIATGRIAATSNKEVTDYLNKLRDAELAQNNIVSEYTIGRKLWQKHILHFAGGSNSKENADFKTYLGRYAAAMESQHFGGHVSLFSKTSGSVIEQLDLDTIRDLIKDGVSMMVFFGHGTTNGFDINVDQPSEWNNKGKYPVVLANSCFSGNIHKPVSSIKSISEEYVLIPNLGAIAFIASPGLGNPYYLDQYNGHLHSRISTKNYRKSIGEQMRLAAADNSPTNITGESNSMLTLVSMSMEMTLHGDPAFRMNPHDKAELTINDPLIGADVRLEPNIITTDLDSFQVVVNVTNLGKAIDEDVVVSAVHVFPGAKADETKFKVLDGIGYQQELRFSFPISATEDLGDNALKVRVDLPSDSIPEFDNFTNNEVANLPFTIIDGDISPVYPYNYEVVPNLNVVLRANTGYPFAPSREYLIEIDTTDTYDSPFHDQIGTHRVTQQGAIIEWDPGLKNYGFIDSTCFFWRVTPSDDQSKWREFSFQIIGGQYGWGQDHFYQFKNNDFDFLKFNRANRRLTFEEASRDLFVNVVGSAQNAQEFDATLFSLDGQGAPLGERNVEPGGQAAMAIVVIDTLELTPWGTHGYENGQFFNEDKQFGNSNSYLTDGADNRARPEYFFSFEARNPAQMDSMVSMINDKVPDGYYILAYTLRFADFENPDYWKNYHFAAFEALGADSIRYVEDRNPYIFFTRKGHPELSEEVIGKDAREVIQLRTVVKSTVKQGQHDSPEIGPAMAWKSFHMKRKRLEKQSGDIVSASSIAINTANQESEVANLQESGVSSLDAVNADSVLDLRLEYFTADNSFGTPAQLKSWHILYDPAPDAAVNPNLGAAFRSASVAAGEAFYFGTAIQNISDFDFGEFDVRYWVTNAQGAVLQSDTLSYKQLLAEEAIFDSVEINTGNLTGKHTLWMQVNPLSERWHKEQYSFNNIAFRTLTVEADKNNPLLDVTFDGIRILNGDIVSPNPEIVMELKDDNTYLLMDDTSSFDVFITYPNGVQNRIPFVQRGAEVMQFEPATSKQNKARVVYKPESLDDGTYTLSVMGRDASGNQSGSENYSIDFEVINRSMITNVMNYPNPFTTSTRFVFTLTGSRVPDVFTIQILSVTGKVVREITKDELGPINIGRNISAYAWDGTDEFGDRLANGVYMYRVIMKITGEHIERLESGADQYFTKDFGKMYLFR